MVNFFYQSDHMLNALGEVTIQSQKPEDPLGKGKSYSIPGL